DKSLFISYVDGEMFIDQRMIVFDIKKKYKYENQVLFLALLNSILSMFFIESFGFGRGQGALDLRATKFKKDFKVLNISKLTPKQKESIINSFQPIANRMRFPLEQEVKQPDRLNFEKVLFEAFGIFKHFEAIKSSLLHLYNIRFATKKE
ncbi:MAG TPA: SAM-dependent DNA methyltransferase, partial [bacterium]|nr:SAM-dependent DNA methyltransferase [bacterium]